MSTQFKLTPDSSKALVYLAIGLVVVIMIAKFSGKIISGITSVLESLGLKDDAETKEIDAEIKEATRDATSNPQESPWSPAMYKSAPSGSRLVTTAVADKAARQIHDSSGYLLPDKPEQAFAAFKLMPSQAAVSFLVERFELIYRADLFSWLTEAFNDTPTQLKVFSQITAYVKNLKKY